MKFLFCGIIQILRNLNLNGYILITADGRVLHGNNAFSSQADLGTGLHTFPDLTDNISVKGRNGGFTAENSGCVRNRNSGINIRSFSFIARTCSYGNLQKKVTRLAAAGSGHAFSFQTDTLAGIKYLKLTIENGKVSKVRVNMGKPILKASEIPVKAEKEPVVAEAIEAGGREWKMTCVSMGNPHAVIFIDTPVKEFPLETYGPLFESHERFPKRTNTEFVRVLDRKTMEMRVWERGSAETLACGTGTCATAVAAVLNGLCDRSVLVHLLGGDLEIEWNEEDGCVYMTGPATTVFDGEITLPEGLE